jgi:KipI family sensor histidine kinase inhibitor
MNSLQIKKLLLAENNIDIRNFNNDFLLIRSEDSNSLMSLGSAIFEMKYHFVQEVIVAEREICLALNDAFIEEDIDKLRGLNKLPIHESIEVELPVFFNDHEDWNEVESISGLSKNEFIERIANTTFKVQMFGFLPGFIYLDGLDKNLHIPRKAIPSKYVEANSIAIGGQYLGLYPLDSPGGWHVIGKTPVSILELNKLPPVSVNLGDRVKIKVIDKESYKRMKG